MSTFGKQLAKFLIRILITTVLLVWVFSRIDLQQFWQTVKTTRWQFLVGVWGLTVTMFWVNSIKMKLILKKQGCNVSIDTIFGASAITLLYGLIIPGVLSAGVKWYILRKDTGKGSNVLSSMLYNQVSTMFVMAVFGLIALIVTNLPNNSTNPWLLRVLCSTFLAAVILVSLLLLSSRTGGRIINCLRLLLSPFPANVRQKGQEIIEQIAIFQNVGGGFHLIILSITIIAIVIGGVFTYILSARGANITAPLGVLVWLCVIVSFLGRLPISIANLGVREATLVGFLALYGVETSPVLLMSMILFSSVIIMAVIGAIYQLYWAVTAKKPNS